MGLFFLRFWQAFTITITITAATAKIIRYGRALASQMNKAVKKAPISWALLAILVPISCQID